MQPFVTWLLVASSATVALGQQYNGGPVQFGPPPTSSRGSPQQQVRSQPPQQQQSIPAGFRPPTYASPVFAAPQNFRPSPEHDFNDLASRRPQASPSVPQYQAYANVAAPQAKRPAPAPKGRGPPNRNPIALESELDDEEEEEEAKPDRLQELLPQSKFVCTSKNTGYYADEGLGCEVFHYCQDGAKHSWVCPDGFTFHQVHLICMPPSHDNICAQSSQYFFVNDYLYQPINAEEARTRPNVTLRYSDRYYPENEQALDEQATRQASKQQAQPQQQQQQARRPSSPSRPSNQVFHSPESVNIPLQQRRVPTPQAPSRPTPATSYDTEEYDYEDFPYRQG